MSELVRDKGAAAEAELSFAQEAHGVAMLFKNGTTGKNAVMGLERWIQRQLFVEVCAVANLQIQSLTGKRYALTLNPGDAKARNQAGGLDLYVIDPWSSSTRQVQSMSGGETFIVSLALALALAEVVQSYFGGIELSSLFVDEGFGSLDSSTLDSTIDMLRSLQSSGRTVGVVTHVEQMQRELPVGLRIIKSSKGSSVEQNALLALV